MAATTWNIDPSHADVQFSAKHMMVTTVRGKFSGVTGTLTLDEEDPAASGGRISLQAATVNSGFEARDNHRGARTSSTWSSTRILSSSRPRSSRPVATTTASRVT